MNKRGQNRSFSLCTFFPRNRRGSHVGAMLSFVIFITFLIFLYSILQPALKLETDKQDMIDYLTSKLRENFTGQLLSISVTVDPYKKGSGADCIGVPNLTTGIEQPSIGLDRNLLIVKNSSNSNLPYFIESNGKDLSIKTGTQFDGFFKIYSSKDIISSKCSTCGISNCYNDVLGVGITYEITSVGQMNETFLKKARTFKANYESSSESYETIKTQLKVPKNIEFSFELKTSEGESINTSTRIVPTGANVYVGEIPILYVDEQANLKSGFLTVKVW